MSLGKIFHFTKNGVPLISRNLYGYKELIERNKIGFTFNNLTEINNLIKTIINMEYKMRVNCIEFSYKYKFENYHKKLENIIEKL